MISLKPVEVGVLIALCEEPGHGYALVQRVEEESDGRVSLLPGNLYAVLRRLTRAGWIKEGKPPEIESGHDQRRRYYYITPSGRSQLALEETSLRRQLTLIQRRLATP